MRLIASLNGRSAARCCAAGSIQARWVFAGDDTRPSSITSFGLIGGAERWLKIPLDVSQRPVTFALQAIFVRKTPVVPFFGQTTGLSSTTRQTRPAEKTRSQKYPTEWGST